MFQFPAFTRDRLWIQRLVTGMNLCRFADSEILGSMLVSNSPRLFAAAHVLHRLPVPRHPPCALCSLTVSRRHTSNCVSPSDPRLSARTSTSTRDENSLSAYKRPLIRLSKVIAVLERLVSLTLSTLDLFTFGISMNALGGDEACSSVGSRH